jgi:hypothetical protein
MIRAVVLVAAILAVACSSQSQRIEELSSSPAPNQTMSADSVRVIDSGFVWDGETLSYAFTIENTSADQSMEETAVQVSVYDARGEAIGGDSGTIDFILPGQVVAHAAHIPLAEEPERIALSFGAGHLATVQSAQTFEPSEGKYSDTKFGGRVVAAIKNPYGQELRRLSVVAIVRAEDGSIINGGSTVLELLPASGESIVTIDLLGSPPSPPASVDIYTQFTAETVYRLP